MNRPEFNVTAFNPNDVEDSMDVWLDYCPYVVKKWKGKVLFDETD